MSAVLEERRVAAPPAVSVIIPAYREAENLPVIIPRLSEALGEAHLAAEIIVVDDYSGDGTREICGDLSQQYPLRLETRESERGLSSAVLHGLRRARGDVLIVMDADLSHPPEKVPELVEALDEADVDFVIGSRYVHGGGTDEDWGLLRWLNSKVATLMARPFTKAADPMAGFFALRRTSFRHADETAELNPIGYKIGLELMVKCNCRRVREVPIQFSNRLHGKSKLSLREQLNYVRHLGRLAEYKLRHLPKLLKFAVVGASGSVVDLLAFAASLALLPVPVARALAIWVAMTWNFYWNRRWTFFESREHGILWQYAMFCGACLIGAVVSWGVSVGLWHLIPFFNEYPIVAAIIGIIAGTLFNFVASSRLVFRKSSSEAAGR
ncbi:MAG: glycosyltransferase family 2 protein [Candidatus Anammoximicrobium sp.]|nr:glycosyltransferase family 2 protein [Candidatus Anammoximicrobium sp.]